MAWCRWPRPIELVITDVVMPDMSGVALARTINTESPTMRLFRSAFSAAVLVREGLEHPAVLFLAKPFTREELLRVTGLPVARARAVGHTARWKPIANASAHQFGIESYVLIPAPCARVATGV